MSSDFARKAGLVAAIVLNVGSVIGVVVFNKLLFRAGFKFPSLLVAAHFLCTWIGAWIAKTAGVFEPATDLPMKRGAHLGLGLAAAVAIVNLSLLLNSVSTYQVLKFVTFITSALLDYFWKGKVYPMGSYISLVGLIAGSVTAMVSSVEFSLLGLVCGLVGAFSTSYYQILNKETQNEHGISPLQLLYAEQRYSALGCFIFACFTENVRGVFAFEYTPRVLTLIACSCSMAALINFSSHLILGKVSALSFLVFGHSKTLGVFMFAVLIRETFTLRQGVGILVTFGAVVAYSLVTYFANQKPKEPSEEDEEPTSSLQWFLGKTPIPLVIALLVLAAYFMISQNGRGVKS